MNLLLYNSDESKLLSFLTQNNAGVILGFSLKYGKQQLVSQSEIIHLDLNNPLTFLIHNKSLGDLNSVREGENKKLSLKTELLGHKPYIDQGLNLIDVYTSPMIIYRRPYFIGNVLSEAELLCPAEESSEKINKWYRKITSWCRKNGTSVFSWKKNDFPINFYSPLTVNTRYAFADALNALKQGKLFCERNLDLQQVEQWLKNLKRIN